MAENSGIGPFARLRAGAVVESAAYVGNFCEVKAAHVGAGTNVCHLSYLGDAELGENVNIGAGTITCNYSAPCPHAKIQRLCQRSACMRGYISMLDKNYRVAGVY